MLTLPGPWEQRGEQLLLCRGEVLLPAAREGLNVLI